MPQRATSIEHITDRRRKALARSGNRIIEIHTCPETGGGVVLVEPVWARGNQVAHFFRPRVYRNAFRTRDITSAHEKIQLLATLREILATEKAAKVAPHDLTPGEVIADIRGYTSQSVRFWRVIALPSPRNVALVEIAQRQVSGDWMAGTVMPVAPDAPLEALAGLPRQTFRVSMASGSAYIEMGSDARRATRWNGQPVQIFCD